jgi:aldehyde:ferredoxin oxidoreductase
MAELYGYTGKILRVDLTTGKVTEESSEKYVPKFMGGRGFGAKIYWDEVSPEAKAFDPENRLIFVTGPATGVPPAGSICQIYGKSPITNPQGFCYSTMTGKGWGPHLKFAGFDGIIVKGKSEKPVYLTILHGEAALHDASHLMGKLTGDVDALLKSEVSEPKAEVLQCGPAAEKGVRFSSLVSMANRHNGLRRQEHRLEERQG